MSDDNRSFLVDMAHRVLSARSWQHTQSYVNPRKRGVPRNNSRKPYPLPHGLNGPRAVARRIRQAEKIAARSSV